MRSAIVIPTLNAVKRGKWPQVLEAISVQFMQPDLKIIIDSSSADATCSLAESYGWVCRKIKKSEFNHGMTRDSIVRELAENGFDTVIFLSQDVILASPDALSEITEFLWQNPVSGCYGKQRAQAEHSLNAWQRCRCYPDKSMVKALKDTPDSGMMTPFFSNAFAAWKTAEVIRYGGFPETDFGEDTLLAARVLNQGGTVGYCSEAVAFHDHSNTPWSLFLRGMQVGSFHYRHPELIRQFCCKGKGSWKGIPLSVLLPLGIKTAGYAWGRFQRDAVPIILFLLMWLLLIPAIVLYDFPQRDVAIRYAPMAEAFANGDWQFAFHPRIPPLFPVSAGIISFLFSCNGYTACQLAASLPLTLGIFPLYAGCRKAYGFSIAAIACTLYAVCAPLLRLGYYGLRDTWSSAGLVLLFFAFVCFSKEYRKIQGYIVFSAAEIILLLNRGDTALFAILMFMTVFAYDMFRNLIAWRSMISAIIIFALLLPFLIYNRQMIGYPVPDVRHAVILRKICDKIPALEFIENKHPQMPLGSAGIKNTEQTQAGEKIFHSAVSDEQVKPPRIIKICKSIAEMISGRLAAYIGCQLDFPLSSAVSPANSGQRYSKQPPAESAVQVNRPSVQRAFRTTVFKGLYPVYFFLFLFGVGSRIRKRKWSGTDTFLITAFIVFEMLASFQVVLFYGTWVASKRYLWIGIPLYLPFAAEGLYSIAECRCMHKYKVPLSVFLCTFIAGISIYLIYHPLVHGRHSRKKRMEHLVSRSAAAWIKDDWKGKTTGPVKLFKCDQYQSGKRPLIQSDFSRIGWLCGGQNYPEFFASCNVAPDYVVTKTPVDQKSYVLAKSIPPLYIYRRSGIAK